VAAHIHKHRYYSLAAEPLALKRPPRRYRSSAYAQSKGTQRLLPGALSHRAFETTLSEGIQHERSLFQASFAAEG
jgi:hypothetical protein